MLSDSQLYNSIARFRALGIANYQELQEDGIKIIAVIISLIRLITFKNGLYCIEFRQRILQV